ncbi:MAG: hypothetical protein M3P30_16300 [Chloroflexota bacterium]|nr:hypothetical protein [Chloroflexota bacterium]
MSREQIQRIFEKNVFTFMETDVRREVDLAKLESQCDSCGAKPGGGNFLAALGLLSYTEFLGSFTTGSYGRGRARNNFNSMYARLGPAYREFGESLDVYDVFRCGMVHEYTVKQSADIAMIRGGEPCGIGRQPNGRLFFVVERYLDDFIVAAKALYVEIMSLDDPSLPLKVE